jgi:hypothetical protein
MNNSLNPTKRTVHLVALTCCALTFGCNKPDNTRAKESIGAGPIRSNSSQLLSPVGGSSNQQSTVASSVTNKVDPLKTHLIKTGQPPIITSNAVTRSVL